ncbi:MULTISPECIES: hypothetical protein [Burkholderiaceae]|nr:MULTISPECIES: hypothetical protein [Burkholderiaceae]MBN3846343.1 hypothetical protein [Paraburkholderia sp. Ac-20342]
MTGIDANELMQPACTIESIEIVMTGGCGDMTARYQEQWKTSNGSIS